MRGGECPPPGRLLPCPNVWVPRPAIFIEGRGVIDLGKVVTNVSLYYSLLIQISINHLSPFYHPSISRSRGTILWVRDYAAFPASWRGQVSDALYLIKSNYNYDGDGCVPAIDSTAADKTTLTVLFPVA